MTEHNTDERSTDSDQGIDERIPTGRDSRHVALVSGGMDSTVAAAVAVETAPKIDALVYLDTGTGVDAATDYIADLADALGVQLWTLRTHVEYEERVRENGFPGASRHSIMYRSLKERQIGKLATMTGDQSLVLWTGVRSAESERRLRHVKEVQEGERWTWVAPIHDWTKADCRAYIAENDLPEADYWSTLGRSVDCFCGCFASREELLDLEAAGYGDHADALRELESEVADEHGKKGRWAWSSMDKSDHAEADDRQMTLCSTCGPVRTDGGDDR